MADIERLMGTKHYPDGMIRFSMVVGVVFMIFFGGLYFLIDQDDKRIGLVEISGLFESLDESGRNRVQINLQDDTRRILIDDKGWSRRDIRSAFIPTPTAVRVLAQPVSGANPRNVYHVFELEVDGRMTRSLDEMIAARKRDDLLLFPVALIGLLLAVPCHVALRHRRRKGMVE